MNIPMATTLVTATGLDELAKEVWSMMAKRVQQLSLFSPYSTDTSSDDDDELPMTMRHRKQLKSGRLHTANTQVLRDALGLATQIRIFGRWQSS